LGDKGKIQMSLIQGIKKIIIRERNLGSLGGISDVSVGFVFKTNSSTLQADCPHLKPGFCSLGLSFHNSEMEIIMEHM
jgi:hypothetical protein